MAKSIQPKDGDRIEKIASCVSFPLYNFDMDLELLDFGDGIAIRRINDLELKEIENQIKQTSRRYLRCAQIQKEIKFVLHVPTIVELTEDQSGGRWHNGLYGKLGDATAYDIISVLRLNPSTHHYIGCDSKLFPYEDETRFYWVGHDIGLSVPENILAHQKFVIGFQNCLNEEKSLIKEPYKISESNADEILQLWKAYNSYDFEKNRFLKIAIKRFNLGHSRNNDEDKIIDYVIAMEAIFCDAKEGISDKISERVALYLGDTTENREEIEKNMKNAYNLRSYFVHGEKGKEKSMVIEVDGDAYVEIYRLLEHYIKLAIIKCLLYDSHLSHEEFITRIKKMRFG